mgnify:FL=1
MSFELPVKPIKDLKKVSDYNRERQLEIIWGMCFKNACVLMQRYGVNIQNSSLIKETFDLTQALFDGAVERRYPEYKKEK